MSNTIFVVDPSNEVRRSLADAVADKDAEVRTFASAEDFLLQVVCNASGCVIASSDLAGIGIRELIAAVHARRLELPVIVLGRDDSLATAVELMRVGAAEYLEAPVSNRRLRTVIRRTIGAKSIP